MISTPIIIRNWKEFAASVIRDSFEKTGRSGVLTHWDVEHLSRRGRSMFRHAGWNMWHDDGEEWIAKAVFDRDASVGLFDDLYVGLDNRGSPGESNTLASLSGENSGNGYARENVDTSVASAEWVASQDGGGYWKATSPSLVFSASGGDWSAVQQAFLTNEISATTGQYLIATEALSQSRTVSDGESLTVTFTITIREPTGA